MSKKMSKYLSRKIRFISVFSMAAVVLFNSYNFGDGILTPTTRVTAGFHFTSMFEFFLSNGICRFAIPMFFAISGFLFFNSYRNTVEGYVHKIKKRAYSLFVPYIIWAILSGLLVTILSGFGFFSGLDVIKSSAYDWSQFYMYLINPPAFQLWYIQQLLLFVVFAPLIYLLVKYTRGLILIIFGGLWACDFSYIVNSTGLFFFCVGAAFAIFGKSRNVTRKDNRLLTVIFSVIWAGVSLGYTFVATLTEKNTATDILMIAICKINEIIGIVAMWFIFDHIAKRITDKKGFLIASTHLFFVYAMHEPLINICYQVGLRQDAGLFGHLALYIGLPLSIGAVCIIISMAFRKNLRVIHRFFMGGR